MNSFGHGRTIRVGDREIGGDNPVFLTAEIGSSHTGSPEDARKMMLAAKEAGCDGADMFISSADDFYHGYSGYEDGSDVRDVIRKFSMTEDQWRGLFGYAREIGLILYVTPLDFPSIDLAGRLGSPMVNVNSDDVNNIPHLERVASLGVPVTMHDINAALAEGEGAVRVLRDNGCRDIIILHSTQESGDEETLYSTANLRVMDTYRSAFSGLGVLTGCVEHTTSDFLIYAVAAREPALISKHLLLRHEEGLPDNSISVDTDSLASMVKKVRYVEMSLGIGVNCLVADEEGRMQPGHKKRRKVLVAARDLPGGHTIGPGDIVAKRPGDRGGLHPWSVRCLYGAKTAGEIPRDTIIGLDMFRDFREPDYKFPTLEKKKFLIKGKQARGA